ncbi:hypothetical protein JCM5296_004381 [Sporobolomyces johnsonii]
MARWTPRTTTTSSSMPYRAVDDDTGDVSASTATGTSSASSSQDGKKSRSRRSRERTTIGASSTGSRSAGELEEVTARAREQEEPRVALERSRERWKDEAGRALGRHRLDGPAILARVQAELAAASARRLGSLGATCERVRSEVGGLGRSSEDAAERREAWDGLEEGKAAGREGLERALESRKRRRTRCICLVNALCKLELTGSFGRQVLVSSIEGIRQTSEEQSRLPRRGRSSSPSREALRRFIIEASSTFHLDNATSHAGSSVPSQRSFGMSGTRSAAWQYSSEDAHQGIGATASMALNAIDHAHSATRPLSIIAVQPAASPPASSKTSSAAFGTISLPARL